jgi:GMP synthase (glutamine-hydrolysing)
MRRARSRFGATRVLDLPQLPASRFLIVQTGSTLPQLRPRHGDFPDWFRRGLGLRADDVDIVRVHEGEALPDPQLHAGAIVTGSPAIVSERARWSETTADWLRRAIDVRLPVLGVCYGHQLLAHALGGRVDYHPGGREVGTIGIERIADGGDDDALLGAMPPRFSAHATHRQSVLEVPAGATVLARSAHDAHQAVRYAPGAWGLQFHPEFSVEIMRGYRRLPGAANCADACCHGSTQAPAPHARHLLRRFREFARSARPG